MRSEFRHPRLSGAAMFLLLAGCATDGGHPVRDIPLMRATVDLSIGVAEGPDEYVFGRIVGVVSDSLGRVFAADLQASEVRVFDSGGEFLFTIGRRGASPGELVQEVEWPADVNLPRGRLIGTSVRWNSNSHGKHGTHGNPTHPRVVVFPLSPHQLGSCAHALWANRKHEVGRLWEYNLWGGAGVRAFRGSRGYLSPCSVKWIRKPPLGSVEIHSA